MAETSIERRFRAALAAHKAGRLDEAAGGYARVIERMPGHLGANTNLGALLKERGRDAEAVPLFRRALAIDPDMTEVRYLLAVALMNGGADTDAGGQFARVAEMSPGDSRPCVGLAALALRAGDPAAALAAAERASARNPGDAHAWSVRGVAGKELGRFDDARAAFGRALAIDPGHAEARYNRGALRLLLGEMPEAWADYAWRWRGGGREPPGADLGLPLWDGGPLDGGRLAVVGEQGFGDAIFALRYLALLRARGIRPVVRCRPELKRLIAAMPQAARVWCPGDPAPAADAYLPMMDLPGVFATDAASVPGAGGYLNVPAPAPCAGPGDRRRIGLVWAGSPTHANDANRSIDPVLLRPLLDLPRCRFVSLQMGARRSDMGGPGLGGRIEDPTAGIGDFADTAAVIAGLDLVISVDTAVAHLAGAMGRPVWVLVPFVPDWRWQLGRADSPWYARARLFRQPSPGDWPAVIDSVVGALSV